jgi:thioesterase domain-containing protein
MMEDSQTFLYLPGGGGGGEHDLENFAAGLDRRIRFETIHYPGWKRYVAEDFSADALVAELTAEVLRRAPPGPIRLMGLSIGGHFAYAIALCLLEMGREVALFCAIDSFMVASSQPRAGWQKRALSDAFDLLKKGRLKDFVRLVQSKVWRALLRLAGGRLAGQLRRSSANGQLPAMFAGDGVAEQELSMRLLLREVAPWVAELDRNPKPLSVPAILLRTEVSASFDEAWKQRCPNIVLREVPGKHLTLFEPENIGGLCDAFETAVGQLAALPQTATPKMETP